MSQTVLRKGKILTVDDPKLKEGDILDLEDMILVLQHYYWQGYDTCPLCNSQKTYHRMRIKENAELSNVFGEGISNASERDYLNPTLIGRERILLKKDVCLKCGNIWVGQMFIWTVLRRKEKLEKIIQDIKNWWLKHK